MTAPTAESRYTLETLRDGAFEPGAVLDFMRGIDDEFSPPVGSMVDLAVYVEKLCTKACVVLAHEQGRIAGLAAIYINDAENRISYIPYLGVGRADRGQGLARRIIEACLERAAEAGMRVVKVRTWESNKAALRLYPSLGFRQVSIDDDRGNGCLSVHFEKALTG